MIFVTGYRQFSLDEEPELNLVRLYSSNKFSQEYIDEEIALYVLDIDRSSQSGCLRTGSGNANDHNCPILVTKPRI
jgi:hypothetical protein